MACGDTPRRGPITTDAELIGSLVAALADDGAADAAGGPVDDDGAAAITIDADVARPELPRRPALGDSSDDVAHLLARRLVELDSARGGDDVDPAR